MCWLVIHAYRTAQYSGLLQVQKLVTDMDTFVGNIATLPPFIDTKKYTKKSAPDYMKYGIKLEVSQKHRTCI